MYRKVNYSYRDHGINEKESICSYFADTARLLLHCLTNSVRLVGSSRTPLENHLHMIGSLDHGKLGTCINITFYFIFRVG